jgi:hypothetical protein
MKAPVTPTGSDVLTPAEVADWLKLKQRQLERFGVPCLHIGHKTRRYLRSDVLAWLEAQRPASARQHPARSA